MRGAVFNMFALVMAVLFVIKDAEFKIKVVSHHKGSLRRASPRFLATHGNEDHDINLENNDQTAGSKDAIDESAQVENEDEKRPYVMFPKDDQEVNEANETAPPNYESQDYQNDVNRYHRNSEDAMSNPVHGIKRDEAMDEMNSEAEALRQKAQQESEEIKRNAKELKQNSTVDQETNTRQVVPKPSGDIVINNKTHVQASNNKASDEEKDILQAVRTATQALYQRAQHKNLPVPDLGPLETPMDIYRALNLLENTIDGYRNSQLESPNPFFNRNYDDEYLQGQVHEEEQTQETEAKQSQQEQSLQEQTQSGDESAEVPKFLQLKQYDGDEGDRYDPGEYDQFQDDASENGDEDDDSSFIAAGDDSDEADAEGAVDEKEVAHPKDAEVNPLANKHSATEILKATIVDLVKALETVLTTSTGIPNIIVSGVNHAHNYNHVASTDKVNHGL